MPVQTYLRRWAVILAALALLGACTGTRKITDLPSPVRVGDDGGDDETPPIFVSSPGPGANGPGPSPSDEPAETLRSVVVIMTDDQPVSQLSSMPNVARLLERNGVLFTNAFAASPLCCPSRAAFLTGNYPHTTGVRSNKPPAGGFSSFQDGSTLGTWFTPTHATAYIGKYMNGYRSGAFQGYVPPGWDRWVSFAAANGAFYNYALSVDGAIIPHADKPEDYSTDVFTQHAVDFIRSAKGPLLLVYSPYAPHGPSDPGPDPKPMQGELSQHPHEASISDKPAWVRERAARGDDTDTAEPLERRMRLSLAPVDLGVARLVTALKETGRLRTTAIVFTSDNGYLLGEHQIQGKEAPYDEATQVPLIIRADWLLRKPRVESGMISNVDLAPTLSSLAGVPYPATDGRNMTRLLRGQGPGRRSVLLELNDNGQDGRASFCAIRTTRYLFVNYADELDEFYDLDKDPNAWRNAIEDPTYTQIRLQLRRTVAERCTPGRSFG